MPPVDGTAGETSMNLWLRLLWFAVTAGRRGKLVMPQAASVLLFRVWPTDLDVSGHMNNGRYLTIMDFGRTDLVLRSGLWRALKRHRWAPIASAILIRYRREMRAFERYTLHTRLLGWSEMTVVMEQRFVFEGGANSGQVAARALFKGGIYDRGARAFVPVARLMQEIGLDVESPPLSPDATAFLAADEALRAAPY